MNMSCQPSGHYHDGSYRMVTICMCSIRICRVQAYYRYTQMEQHASYIGTTDAPVLQHETEGCFGSLKLALTPCVATGPRIQP